MAARKAAESTLYHVHPKGFWKKFHDAVVVNPEISSGLPIPDLNRYPQPGSRPEIYSSPATKASDPAQNPYWKRDVRRAYPQLSVVTQSDLSTLLIQHSQPQTIAAPTDQVKDVPAEAPDAVDLTQAIATVASISPIYSETKLPPKVPTPFKRWRPERAADAPHDPNAYFPMLLYK
ncbi:hypothetical protein V8E55_004418 [Tylopilus felleus]